MTKIEITYVISGITIAAMVIVMIKEWRAYHNKYSSGKKFIRRLMGAVFLILTAIFIAIGFAQLSAKELRSEIWLTVALSLGISFILGIADIVIEMKKLREEIKKECDRDISELIAKIKENEKNQN